MKYKKLLESKFGSGRILCNQNLNIYTTYKIGGPAEYFLVVTSSEELIRAIEVALSVKIPVTLIGSGSNILISDSGISGLVIRNESNQIKIQKRIGKMVKGNIVNHQVVLDVDSGVLVNKLVRYTCDEGLAGLEVHLGLPGTIGGALYMNSKWTKPISYIGDQLLRAKIMTQDGKIVQVNRDYFHFAYDSSILQKTHEIVINASFGLKTENSKILWQRANESIAYRQKTQPMGYKSAGCVFRNIQPADAMRLGTPNYTTSAGYLLDQVGMKNYHHGDAVFSDKHANFVINQGNARASDILELIREAKKRVYERFGIKLELEIGILGNFTN